ncbi:hypothetical protein F5887DRAFT_670450 [Amanita rubescens]|nr:hypothetical protein F5887DRAFT_670450 [Amanita rubescens]
MVHCALCYIWYHFTCVDLSEPEAEDISIFVCPSCTESTGRRTISEYLKPLFFRHRHIYIVIPRYVVVKSQTCRIMPRITLSFASTISGVPFLSSWRYMRGLLISCTCPLWRCIGAS